MFGGSTFVSMGNQVKLMGQAPAPAPAAQPAPAPAPAPRPAAPVVGQVVTTGMSRGTQVAIAATVAGLSILGAIFLTD